MIELKQLKDEDRKTYLVRLAVAYIDEHTGFTDADDRLFYDDAEWDGYCLAEDLRVEFDIDKKD